MEYLEYTAAGGGARKEGVKMRTRKGWGGFVLCMQCTSPQEKMKEEIAYQMKVWREWIDAFQPYCRGSSAYWIQTPWKIIFENINVKKYIYIKSKKGKGVSNLQWLHSLFGAVQHRHLTTRFWNSLPAELSSGAMFLWRDVWNGFINQVVCGESLRSLREDQPDLSTWMIVGNR